jgi:hypothetical protein
MNALRPAVSVSSPIARTASLNTRADAASLAMLHPVSLPISRYSSS